MHRADAEIPVVAACVPNIGARGRRRRVTAGVVWILIAGAVFVALARRKAPVYAFLLVAPFAAMAAVGFFQAKEKT